MGNRPSRQRAKQQKKNRSGTSAPPALPATVAARPQDEHASVSASAQKQPADDHEQGPSGREGEDMSDTSNQAEAVEGEEHAGDYEEGEEEEEEEEDPLQFFRRLSSLSNGEPEGERESQDLFMSYTQALLLKEAGDYAAASTLFRLMRNYKSLEVEAQYHLAQCLLLLDPDLRCFGDEIVVALERVCSTSSAELLDAGAWDKMQRVSMELLAHVLASQGHFERARSMLRALRGGNQYEEQESVLGFQTALCELALGDLDAAHTQLARVDCRASLPLVHVDARAVERALVLSQRRRRTMSVGAAGAGAARRGV